MPATPKKRTSKSSRDSRRAHDALDKVTVIIDKETGSYRLPHHIDLETGKYKGRQLMEVKS